MPFPGGDEERGRGRVYRISTATTTAKTATTATTGSSNSNANSNANSSRAVTGPDSCVSSGVEAVGQAHVARGSVVANCCRRRYRRPAVKKLFGNLFVAVLAGEAKRGELDGRESFLVGASIEQHADQVQAAVE